MLRGIRSGINRRIVEKDQVLFSWFGSVQTQPQTADLPVHHFFGRGAPPRQTASPGFTQRIAIHRIGIVVQQMKGVKPSD